MRRHALSARVAVGVALALLLGTVASAEAQVSINIRLPGPPQLVAVPAHPGVAYAPSVDANYFSFDGEYYVFSNSAWYASRGYNGPWVAVAPVYVPRPLLSVPVQYYRRPPGAWRHWQRAQAPRWQKHWGQRWDGRHEGQALPRERSEGRGQDRQDDRHDRDGRDRHDNRR